MNTLSFMNEVPSSVEKATVVTNDFGLVFVFDVAFGLLGRSEVKDKFCSSQEGSINIYVGVILSSNVWLKDKERASTRDSKSRLS